MLQHSFFHFVDTTKLLKKTETKYDIENVKNAIKNVKRKKSNLH